VAVIIHSDHNLKKLNLKPTFQQRKRIRRQSTPLRRHFPKITPTPKIPTSHRRRRRRHHRQRRRYSAAIIPIAPLFPPIPRRRRRTNNIITVIIDFQTRLRRRRHDVVTFVLFELRLDAGRGRGGGRRRRGRRNEASLFLAEVFSFSFSENPRENLRVLHNLWQKSHHLLRSFFRCL